MKPSVASFNRSEKLTSSFLGGHFSCHRYGWVAERVRVGESGDTAKADCDRLIKLRTVGLKLFILSVRCA